MAVVTWQEKIKQAVDFLKKEVATPPTVVVILSGGLTQFVDGLKDQQSLDVASIPHCPKSTAEGHKGQVVFGKYNNTRVAVFMGRTHYYEGYSLQEITFSLHAMHVFGAKTLMITNAVGAVNPSFAPGDLMVIRDHMNFMGDNPLRGIANQTKTQFVDMTSAYTSSLQQVAHQVAEEQKLRLREGVYLATTGPSYETPSEIRAFRQLGADAVGMSVVPEVIVASFHRMHVLGISIIANMAADLHVGGMNHAEVLKAVQASESKLVALLQGVLDRLGRGNAH